MEQNNFRSRSHKTQTDVHYQNSLSGKDSYSNFFQKFLWITSNIVKSFVGKIVFCTNQSSSYLASYTL